MWFYEYTVPNCGDSLRWDCGDCMKAGKHKRTRNCGGKYPEASWAKKGFNLGPMTIYQCPKTFIRQSSMEILKYMDTTEKLGVKVYERIQDVPQIYVDFKTVIDRQRQMIAKSLASNSAGNP